jgi:hypothetical protein
MGYKMKGFPQQAGVSPMKQKTKKKWDIKGYLKGKQGYIPDYKGKPTRQAMNESTLTNPKSASEVGSDQTDTRMYTRLMKDQFARDKAGKKTSKADAAYLKHYSDKDKKIRPNRKDRY